MRFSQLWPEQGEVDIEQYVRALRFADRAPADRPFTVANFVSSVDGRATVEGRSGGLGDDGDKAIFRALRREVDAVLVGTGTLVAERYGRILRDPQSRELRGERGLSPEPLACTVTRRGELPLDIPLFAEPEARVVVFTAAEIDITHVRAQIEVVRLAPEQLTLTAALRHLRRQHGVRALLCEGGPRIFSSLVHEGVVDQLFLTLAPRLVGGRESPAITTGPAHEEPAQMSLDGVLELQGSLFLRYGIGN